MKQLFVLLFAMNLWGIAMFGFLAVDHGVYQNHEGCIAATLKGMNCPDGSNSVSFVAFHLGALKYFSTATFSGELTTMLIFFVFFISTIAFSLAKKSLLDFSSLHFYLPNQLTRESFIPLSCRRFIRWLALHENSPALS